MSMAIFTENKQTPKNCSLTNMVTHKNRKKSFHFDVKSFLYRHTQDSKCAVFVNNSNGLILQQLRAKRATF